MNKAQDFIILLHGIGRTSRSMRSIERALAKNNQVLNIDYPSRKKPIGTIANEVYQQIITHQAYPGATVHFVTHSLGSIVTRELLDRYPLEQVKRIVMLGPPNQGSEVADFIKKKLPPVKAFYGPALEELTIAQAQSHPFLNIADKYEVGIIAGNINIDPICYFLLSKPHDGKVTVESTKLAGMADHIILPLSHSFMMYSPQAIFQINHFLEKGCFFHNETISKANNVKK